MKKQITIICMTALLLTGCAAKPDEAKSLAGVPQSMATAIAEAVHVLKPGEITELAEQPGAETPSSDEKKERQAESVAEPVSEPEPKPERDIDPSAQAESEPSEAASTQPEMPASVPQAPPAPVQSEPQHTPEPAPAPEPQPPTRPAFDSGTVIGMACSQIGGMTRVNGAEQGMGSFTHSFSVNETQESIAAGLAAILAQERDLYGNTYYDIVYCGESSGYHTFRCYRA